MNALATAQSVADYLWSKWLVVVAVPALLLGAIGLVSLVTGATITNEDVADSISLFIASWFFLFVYVAAYRSNSTSSLKAPAKPVLALAWLALLAFFFSAPLYVWLVHVAGK